MELIYIKDLKSKKNKVFLAKNSSEKLIVVKNFNENKIESEKEADINAVLNKNGISVPKLIKKEDTTIYYEYIQGISLIEYTQKNISESKKIFIELIYWLKEFYVALFNEYDCDMIFNDAHLKNFLYDININKIYGFDFENVKKGRREKDIASLIAFVLTYTPSFTKEKQEIAKVLFSESLNILSINKDILIQEIKNQISILENRRNISYSNHSFLSDLYSK